VCKRVLYATNRRLINRSLVFLVIRHLYLFDDDMEVFIFVFPPPD
jgi:hypothetical protein